MTPLSKLQEIARAATPGPWFYDSYSRIFSDNQERNAKPDVCGHFEPGDFFYEVAQVEVVSGDTATKEGSANAEYIATFSPRLIEKLLAEVMAMREMRDKTVTVGGGMDLAKLVEAADKAREALDAETRLL